MTKRDALKIAKEVKLCNLRHYGRGKWAVELADGAVIWTVEAWVERCLFAIQQAAAEDDGA